MSSFVYAGQRVNLKCPTCKSTNFELTETMEENVIYEVVDGVLPAEATDHQAGGALGLSAWCCQCRHEWRPRAKLLGDVVAG